MTDNENLDNRIESETETSENPRKKRDLAHIIMLSVLALLLLATIILVAVLTLPAAGQAEEPIQERPVIEIGDSGGKWEEQGSVAMFGNSLRPGSSGKYEFVLKNPHEFRLSYGFLLTPKYEDGKPEYFPIKFKLKMNNLTVLNDQWLDVDKLTFTELLIEPNSTHAFTLEWSWPFESGADENDTLLGRNDGTIALILQLSAQTTR